MQRTQTPPLPDIPTPRLAAALADGDRAATDPDTRELRAAITVMGTWRNTVTSDPGAQTAAARILRGIASRVATGTGPLGRDIAAAMHVEAQHLHEIDTIGAHGAALLLADALISAHEDTRAGYAAWMTRVADSLTGGPGAALLGGAA